MSKSDPIQLCQYCKSQELISISAKHNDAFTCTYINDSDKLYHDGYGFDHTPWSDHTARLFGDYFEMDLCLTCGRVQGRFPIHLSDVKKELK